jgi:5-methylcytosine-specific restriction endonuclease McrA
MKMIRPKAAPPRLDPLSYESLRQQILRRDGWRCQSCGTMSNLEVHHREFRRHSGSDSEENLISSAQHATPECIAAKVAMQTQQSWCYHTLRRPSSPWR